MRLDHISYVTSHDQLADTVQRLGSRLGSTFVDGGVHPRFGTRNFTLPLLNGQYLEVVCPLDHPATDSSPFGRAVLKRANEGGGWLTWVLSVDDVHEIESRLGRSAVDGHRTKPDGTNLKWKQIGVLGTLDDRQLPFFVQWESMNHPAADGTAYSKIVKMEIAGNIKKVEDWVDSEIHNITEEVVFEFFNNNDYNEECAGLFAVHFDTPIGYIKID